MDLDIRPLSPDPALVATLADILTEVVADGGSVSFMHPLEPAVAAEFWRRSLAAAASGTRVVLGARVDGELVASVTLDLATPDNQRHRAEIAKLMTRPSHRGRGCARALMLEAERRAALAGRTLLTLDTAEEGGASALYESLGYQRAGRIPDYAEKPLGGLTATILYFKRLGPGSELVGASQGSR
jgi:ribosomal protein S18 acetylase RimI-like enzyme